MRCSAESPSLGSVVCCPDKGGRGMKITVINMYRSFCYKKKVIMERKMVSKITS